ncbi:MAG: LexA family transcriptional regulator [Sulfuricurvum sp.]|nr:LexA family transcriptional regulator [Sulfuricurvum sp.]
MKTFSDIVETIKDIVSSEFPERKVFDKDIADLLEISQMNFATMKKRNKIPFNELLDFCAKRSIAINWLLYNQSPESLIEPTNRFYMVRYFSSVSASAGGGAENDELSYEPLMLEENFVLSLGGEKELHHIEAINVSGDSMEPTFGYNDIIFINRTKNDISRGGIFTIRTEHGLFVKRIQVRIDGKLDIISDNKDYPTYVARRDEVEIIGRVVGRFGRVE